MSALAVELAILTRLGVVHAEQGAESLLHALLLGVLGLPGELPAAEKLSQVVLVEPLRLVALLGVASQVRLIHSLAHVVVLLALGHVQGVRPLCHVEAGQHAL